MTQEVLDGKIIRLLNNYTLPPLQVYGVKPDHNLNACSTLFLDFIKKYLLSLTSSINTLS